jgi:Histidine kinase-, DNA gyrase B-, and HSP90-like ATPase
MALRTFHFNPSLGGFGGDQSPCLSTERTCTSDAFCQIIKELVDNAVDACISRQENANEEYDHNTIHQRSNETRKKRVRVIIERFHEQRNDSNNVDCKDSSCPDNNERDCNMVDEILRVTVSDTGCGMRDIQKCVSAFHTSKAHASLLQAESNKAKESDEAVGLPMKRKRIKTNPDKPPTQAPNEGKTAGRYGVGLTLCLLHAQRLVPNSCASIRSATPDQKCWTNMLCVVDAARDSVHCLFHEDEAKPEDTSRSKSKNNIVLPQAKSFPTESGTAISILIPVSATFWLVEQPYDR